MLTSLLKALLPNPNPIGFGPADAIELMLALILLVAALWGRSWILPRFKKFAERTVWCMVFLAISPVALRLLLLSHHPVPRPDVYDEFSHLLEADTLRHFRLSNPPHALPQFFETFFVLQEPTYSSIYPIGPGLAMATGWMLFGLPWAGVLLSAAALCSLCYWMLRGWTTPAWALAGGLLAVIEFGPLCPWMNTYWGGSLAAAAGCLVFGALPRLRESARVRDGVFLGIGIAVHWLTRPYETTFLVVSVAVFLAPQMRSRRLLRPLQATAAVCATALVVTLAHDRATTGSWTTMPEMLSQYQYGVPAALTFQAPAVPHRALTPEQQIEYRAQVAFRAPGPETLGSYLARLEYRIRHYRFYFLAPLYLALPAFLLAIRELRFLWAAGTLAVFAGGVNFFPAFQFHYEAAVTCLFILVSVTGLRRMSRWQAGAEAARILLVLSVAHFAFWYTLHVFDGSEISLAMRRYETWNTINHGNPDRRILVNHELAKVPGRLLIFVRYWPQHIFQNEWVYNDADIDGARVVWARDLGAADDEQLHRYYPDRTALLLEPDATPPKLSPYRVEAPIVPAPATPQPEHPPEKNSSQPALRFQDAR